MWIDEEHFIFPTFDRALNMFGSLHTDMYVEGINRAGWTRSIQGKRKLTLTQGTTNPAYYIGRRYVLNKETIDEIERYITNKDIEEVLNVNQD